MARAVIHLWMEVTLSALLFLTCAPFHLEKNASYLTMLACSATCVDSAAIAQEFPVGLLHQTLFFWDPKQPAGDEKLALTLDTLAASLECAQVA